jgi:hypothetical protein
MCLQKTKIILCKGIVMKTFSIINVDLGRNSKRSMRYCYNMMEEIHTVYGF